MKAFNHHIQFYAESSDTNEYGEQLPPSFVFDSFADVRVRGGSEAQSFGAIMTTTIITAQTYIDSRAGFGQILRWNNKDYRVQHVRPDENNQYMIVTAQHEVH